MKNKNNSKIYWILFIGIAIIGWQITDINANIAFPKYIETLLPKPVDNTLRISTYEEALQRVKQKPKIEVKPMVEITNPLEVKAEILRLAKIHNFRWPAYLVALAKCESGFRSKVRGVIKDDDRGLFQISKTYHPNVSDECAFNIACSTIWTMEKINEGKQSMWICDKLIK